MKERKTPCAGSKALPIRRNMPSLHSSMQLSHAPGATLVSGRSQNCASCLTRWRTNLALTDIGNGHF